MPDELISQFDRKYNNPIETNRSVETITQRDSISTSTRWEGMLVYVESENTTYQLTGGVDNSSWNALVGLNDAPVDGSSYVRKDGSWQILAASGLPYLLYSATLVNSSSGSPVVTVLHNSTGINFTWTRSAVGVMVAVPSTPYDINKVTITAQILSSGTIENERIGINRNSSNIGLVLLKNGVASDDGNTTSVEIKIYA